MAQKRLREYNEPANSFEHNLFSLAKHGAGRFLGFDTMTLNSGGNLTLGHAGSNRTYKNELGVLSNPIGLIVSQQGVGIIEDAPITGLVLDNNVGNSYPRFDLIVCNHDYIFEQGGSAATYSVIKGAVNTTLKPVPTSPTTQVIIGYVKIPANSSNFAGAEWIKAKSPDSGDGEDARLHYPNKFTKTQNFSELDVSDVLVNPAGYTPSVNDLVVLKSNGNSVIYQPNTLVEIGLLGIDGMDVQPGLELTILANHNVRLVDRAITNPEIAQGLKRIRIADVDFTTVSSKRAYVIPTGKIAILHLKLFSDNTFYLTSHKVVDFKPIFDGFKPGMLVDVWLSADDINNGFDTSGLGINDWVGYCLPNGNTYPTPLGVNKTTPDLRGRIRMTWDGLPSVGAPSYDTSLGSYTLNTPYGSKSKTLEAENIPKHHFNIFGGGGAGGAPGPNDTLSQDVSAGGNASYRIQKTTGNATSGKTNSFGGDSNGATVAFDLLQPTFALCTIMKLY